MEVRQKIVLSSSEVHEIITEHLKRKGFRLLKRSADFSRDGIFSALTMTEDEVYIVDTMAILAKPFSSFELKNKALKKKLLAKLDPFVPIANLLTMKLEDNNSRILQDFRKNNFINEKLFVDTPGTEDRLTPAEENILIKTFSELAIPVNKRD